MSEDKTVLMEREISGLLVQLVWEPLSQSVLIHTETDLGVREATVPSERALDAFWHPAVYVDDLRELLS